MLTGVFWPCRVLCLHQVSDITVYKTLLTRILWVWIGENTWICLDIYLCHGILRAVIVVRGYFNDFKSDRFTLSICVGQRQRVVFTRRSRTWASLPRYLISTLDSASWSLTLSNEWQRQISRLVCQQYMGTKPVVKCLTLTCNGPLMCLATQDALVPSVPWQCQLDHVHLNVMSTTARHVGASLQGPPSSIG